MPLHDFWPFDQAPQGSTDLSTGSGGPSYATKAGTYYQYTGNPGYAYNNGIAGAVTVGSDAYLKLSSNSTSNPGLAVQAKEVQDWTTSTQYWIGFRTKTSAQNASAANIFTMSDTIGQANPCIMVQEKDMTAAGANVLNQDYMVEIFIDRSAKTYQVWIAGTQVASGSIPATTIANGLNSFYWFGPWNSSLTANTNRSFRDFYWVDVDATFTPSRLGSVRSTVAPLASVNAPNYFLGEAQLVGSAGISATQTKVGLAAFTCGATAGSYAQILDRTGLRLTTSAWTIEGWLYMTSVGGDVLLLEKSANGTIANRAWVEFNAQQVYMKTDGTSAAGAVGSSTGIPGANQWFHFAAVQNGSTLTVYINGVSIGSISNAATWGNQAGNLIIGQNYNFSAPNFPGYVDELRISNVARYTGNFTPSTSAFVADANTMLLMHFESTSGSMLADDASSSALAILQSPLTVTPLTIPAIVNAATDDTLTSGFTSNVSGKVLAVDYRLAAQSSSAVPLHASLNQSGTVQTLSDYTFSDTGTMKYGRRIALNTTAPDGGAWTPGKVAATALLLTPTN